MQLERVLIWLLWGVFFVFCFVFWVLETRFLCIALGVLELTLYSSLVLNSEICPVLLWGFFETEQNGFLHYEMPISLWQWGKKVMA